MRDQLAAALRGDRPALRSHAYSPETPFWQAAEEDCVHLLVIDAARRTAASLEWPASAAARARQVSIEAAVVQSIRERELRRVLDRLAEANVSCLLLKGAALAHTHYPRPYVRPRRDTDLLVRRQDMDRAVVALESSGYARAVETSGELATSQYHFERIEPRDGLHALDLHWRIANPRVFADRLTYDQLAATRTRVPDLGPHAWTLAPGHALVVACIHRVAHHGDSDNLLWLWDVHLLASTLSEEDARAFVELASQSATRAVCARGLMLAAERFGTAGARDLLERVAPVPESEPEASARFLDGGLRLVDVLRADLNATQAWRARATLVREHLFPPVSYIRATYAGWPMAFLPLAYAHRIITGAPRWFRRPRRQ
jgi:hypothetical protein